MVRGLQVESARGNIEFVSRGRVEHMKRLMLIGALTLGLAAGCGDNPYDDLVGPDGPGQSFRNPDGDPGDWDPKDPQDMPENPDDEDNDGIPDPDDNIPCAGFKLFMGNDGVSSATVWLNGEEILGTSDFPSSDIYEIVINPNSGENILELGGKLAGSPSDAMDFLIQDDQGNIYLDASVVRANGTPSTESLEFVIDVSCES
jgi:hypothetical protein